MASRDPLTPADFFDELTNMSERQTNDVYNWIYTQFYTVFLATLERDRTHARRMGISE